jgi:hypothetical protein
MSPASVAAFRAAVADPRAIERYEAKVHRTGDCDWWTGAVSGNGHGRFWLAEGVTVISHRFGWALVHGADAALQVEVLAHACDEPLCQNSDHLTATTNERNRREWASRRRRLLSSLRDRRGGRGRALAIRAAIDSGSDLIAVTSAGALDGDKRQEPLW